MTAAPKPLVSILIPCFNGEGTLAQAIESALNQTYDQVEVVIVDDGSTDSSVDVLRGYENRPRFRWFQTENRGGNAARNLLLKKCAGRYIQFLDADDELAPTKLEAQVPVLEDGADVVLCDFVERSVGGQEEQIIRLHPPERDLLAYFIRHSIWTVSPLHRVESLRAAGGFDEALDCCQEYELHWRLARSHWRRAEHVAHPLAYRNRMAGSVSSDDSRIFGRKYELILRWTDQLLASGELTDDRRRALGEVSYMCGRHLARRGVQDRAREAFLLAQSLGTRSSDVVSWPMAALTRVLGPVRAERLRQRVRRS